MSYGVGHRRGLGLVWLWLWYRLAATARIRPLAWEPPCAAGVALKGQKDQKKKKKKKKKKKVELEKGGIRKGEEIKGHVSQCETTASADCQSWKKP